MSKVQYYKVKEGKSVGGYGGKYFTSGEVVTDKNFPPKNAEILCKEGFLEKTTAPKEETKPSPEPEVKRLIADQSFRLLKDEDSESPSLVTIDEVKEEQIKAELTRLGTEFDTNLATDKLFELLPIADENGVVKCKSVLLSEVKKDDIKDELTRLGVEFDSAKTKAELFEKLPSE